MKQVDLAPNLMAARAFLDILEPDGTFTFQTFAEGPGKDMSSPPAILHGKLDDVASRLITLNNAGHGIFLMVNKGDLHGRKADNVVQVRAHFIDLDGAPIQPVYDADLPPHVIVESSPDRWHAYWRVDDCPLDQFKQRQQALAARFNSDKAVCDLPRVMRLPGFWHLKSGVPFQTKLVVPNIKGQPE